MLRKLICGTLWLLATGVTAAIVYLGMGTASWIVTALGAIGIISASCGIYIAMDARKHGARIALIGGVLLWLLGEAFVIPSEINFWSATVTAKAEREMDYQRQANGRRLILDDTAKQLQAEAPKRPVGEIQADINTALAKTYNRKTLASLTANCTDLASPSIRFCRDVFGFQKELSGAQDRNTKATLVWEANQQLAVDTAEAHGAHDGPARLSELFGGTPVFWSNIILAVTILLLWFNRGFGLAMGSTKAKAKSAAVTPLPEEEKRPEPASVTPAEIAPEAAAVTPEVKEEPAPVTPECAEPANDNAVTDAPDVTAVPEIADATWAPDVTDAPAKAKKARKKKPADDIDWSNVTALVPKIHLSKQMDHVTAALDAVIDSGLNGHRLRPAEGRKRVNAILKHKHVKPISQGQFDKWSRERCEDRNIDCVSQVGRQLKFIQRDDANGKRKNSRLGSAIPA